MESSLSQTIEEYNSLVKEWNSRYGNKCKAMSIEKENIDTSRLRQIQNVFSGGMSERRKLSMTVKVVGDFKNIKDIDYDGNDLSRGELAGLIVERGNDILGRI